MKGSLSRALGGLGGTGPVAGGEGGVTPACLMGQGARERTAKGANMRRMVQAS